MLSAALPNRRIGEFLKELKFTEGRATGIPKILRALQENGSPPPEFEFDEDHSYSMVRLPVHPTAKEIAGPAADGQGISQATGEVAGEVTREVRRLLTQGQVLDCQGRTLCQNASQEEHHGFPDAHMSSIRLCGRCAKKARPITSALL